MSSTSDLISHFYVTLGGSNAPEQFMRDLVEITVEASLHMPDAATLVLHDSLLKWIDDDSLTPGTPLVISAPSAAGDDQEHKLFDGEIVEIEPEFAPSAQRLSIRALDRLHRLSEGRHVRTFQNVTDADLAQRVAGQYGLQTDIAAGSLVHDYVLQGNETDLRLLRRRATALGCLLYVDGQTLCFKPADERGRAVELRWGHELLEFRPRLTALGQVGKVTVRGWDPGNKREIVGQAGRGKGVPGIGLSESGGEMVQRAFHIQAEHLETRQPVRTQAAADELAQAVADRSASRFVEADGRCGGDTRLDAGVFVRVTGAGDRFSGTYLVTSTTHTCTPAQGYMTQFTVSGQNPSTLLSLLHPDHDALPAQGLAVGIVTDNQDPLGWGRVRVRYPWLSGEHTSDWARLVVTGAGDNRGIEFLPEVNDEVLVGFEMGDIGLPYILGGLWNGCDAPPQKNGDIIAGGKVQQRIIRSRAGHTITLDDSDGGGGIVVEDSQGNRITIESGANNITIAAKGNLTLEAQGQVEIKGTGIRMDGGASTVDIKGSLINLN